MFSKLLSVILLIAVCNVESCDKIFSQCFCGKKEIFGEMQFVVNCTDTGFTNASILAHIPPETQVLIFTGNNISELPWNVFGTNYSFDKLKVIDMSNNHIREIKGKSFHRVPNVTRLILNHNEITISSDGGVNHEHPRVFSNFESLEELHLTNAFLDNPSEEVFSIDLRDIFISSNLSKLKKLHLEQNEITGFKEPKVFCDLRGLMDLHLGDNKLTHIDFEISCLRHLRFIDLEGNAIQRFSSHDLMTLDTLPNRNQNLIVDMSGNPLSCGCDIEEFFFWLEKTKVEIRDKNRLKCRHDKDGNSYLVSDLKPEKCPSGHSSRPVLQSPKAAQCSVESSHVTTTTFLALALALSIALLVYTNRVTLRAKLWPVVQTVTRKVHYTSIGKQETQEMDV